MFAVVAVVLTVAVVLHLRPAVRLRLTTEGISTGGTAIAWSDVHRIERPGFGVLLLQGPNRQLRLPTYLFEGRADLEARIESTRETDTPFVFVAGKGEAIPAFEEAVLGMAEGGLRRFEVPGERVDALAYPLDKETRYNKGPVPTTFQGRRAIDFVLDSSTLKPFNRTLLFDVRVSRIRKRS